MMKTITVRTEERVVTMKQKRVLRRCLAVIIACAMLVQTIGVETVLAADVYVDRKADVVFVIDATGSMGSYITSVKEHLTKFINMIDGDDVDVRVRFVVYRDMTYTSDEIEKTVISPSWYTSSSSSKVYLNSITATGGGDGPETLLDGLGAMLQDDFGFRAEAAKFCIVLTDVETKLDNSYGYATEEEVINKLIEKNINTSMIVESADFSKYNKYCTPESFEGADDAGILADIAGEYSILLRKLADLVITVVDWTFGEMSPTYGIQGEETTVKVLTKGLDYGEGFGVVVGDTPVTVSETTENYISFVVPDTLKIGSYKVKVTSGGEEGTTKEVGTFTVKEKPKEMVITGVSQTSSTVGETPTIKVTGENFNYGDGFEVTVDKKNADITAQLDSYFKFVLPSGLSTGTHVVTITNGITGDVYKFNYTCNPKPTSVPLEVLDYAPKSVQEGTSVIVKATKNEADYGSDFAVTVGGKAATVENKLTGYFKFTVPNTLAAGSYDIEVTNNGTTMTIGQFTYSPKPIEPPVKVKDYSPKSTTTGKSVTVKVTTLTAPNYGSDFAVKIGGKTAKVRTKISSYFKFDTPTDLTPGTYDIEITNNGATIVIGQFTYN